MQSAYMRKLNTGNNWTQVGDITIQYTIVTKLLLSDY